MFSQAFSLDLVGPAPASRNEGWVRRGWHSSETGSSSEMPSGGCRGACRSQAGYLLMPLCTSAFLAGAYPTTKPIPPTLFLDWMMQVLFGNVFFPSHPFCPGSTWFVRKTKWQPPSQGQYKYLFGNQGDECLICFEGGSQGIRTP